MIEIDWSEQKCGIHRGNILDVMMYMPDVYFLIKKTFIEKDLHNFIWDVKVHMLMPNQYPCIPNWHYDNVPRVNNKQDFDLIQKDKPMYIWVSNEPLTEFRKDGESWFIKEKTWTKITQLDEHRGSMSKDFQWRGFIRATHKDIAPQNDSNHNPIRQHTQVYLDVKEFQW